MYKIASIMSMSSVTNLEFLHQKAISSQAVESEMLGL